jgi:hypothetical protein
MMTPEPWSQITLPNGDRIVGNLPLKLVVCMAPEYPLVHGEAAWNSNGPALAAVPEMIRALERAVKFFDEALPEFNYGASALDSNAIRLLNEVPGEVRAALDKAKHHG